MGGASSILSSSNAAMVQVQSFTKNILARNGIDEAAVSASNHPAIQKLLGVDKNAIGESIGDALGDIPATMAMPEMKAPTKQRKPRKPKDPNAPKRPVTAFFLFLQENKEAVAREMPNAKPGEIQKRATQYWRDLGEENQDVRSQLTSASRDMYCTILTVYIRDGKPNIV